MVKTQKKQRKENNEFDTATRDREDVQSPAYSDISDDSTPVADSEMFKDKSQATKHPADVIPKKAGDIIPPQSQMGPLTGYGMFPFYPHHQQPYLVSQQPQTPGTQQIPPADHANGKQPPNTNPAAAPDYNKIKDPPLDLMTKPSAQPMDTSPAVSIKDNLPHSITPPTMTQAKFMGNYYPYK